MGYEDASAWNPDEGPPWARTHTDYWMNLINGRDGKPLVKEPKTEKSRRAVAISSETVEALRRHKARQTRERLKAETYNDNDLVIARPDGHYTAS